MFKNNFYYILVLSIFLVGSEVIAENCVHCEPDESQLRILNAGEISQDITNAANRIRNPLCRNYKKFIKKGVPKDALKQALTFYQKNKNKIKNQKYISIADYSKSSTTKRYFLLNMDTGNIQRFKVSHGSGSKKNRKFGDPDHDGYIDRCQHLGSNSRTNMTRPGFFITGNTYYSTGSCSDKSKTLKTFRAMTPRWRKKCTHEEFKNSKGQLVYGWPQISNSPKRNALRLHGQTAGVNDKAYKDGVVMHGAFYNRAGSKTVMGRSYGCPAFTPSDSSKIINRIKNKSLYYSYVPKCSKDMEKVKKQVEGWQNICESSSI